MVGGLDVARVERLRVEVVRRTKSVVDERRVIGMRQLCDKEKVQPNKALSEDEKSCSLHKGEIEKKIDLVFKQMQIQGFLPLSSVFAVKLGCDLVRPAPLRFQNFTHMTYGEDVELEKTKPINQAMNIVVAHKTLQKKKHAEREDARCEKLVRNVMERIRLVRQERKSLT
eukprot:TRINITY_DN14475_c0_g2_i17.p1 TRINITY_DN14475_c0_g2~~TRINITY_DN14475_c0_g2_i17.p1  ORF type:complete len:170 (-),score=27.88 TRINITY_DN14475_c0_g2_i17:135-644(-)